MSIQEEKLTPMVKQYKQIKQKHKDKILLFRLGDFYEMFEEDAYEASKILNIALTSRNNMPMCGFPFHSATQYIHKLIKAGKKVAICEQLEDPSKAKGVVKRDVIQIITPSTFLDIDSLDSTRHNYLMALVVNEVGQIGLGFVEPTTGEFLVTSLRSSEDKSLYEEIIKFSPIEIILPHSIQEKYQNIYKIIQRYSLDKNILVTSFPDSYFSPDLNASIINEYITSQELKEKIWKLDNSSLKNVICGIIRYLYDTQLTALRNLTKLTVYQKTEYMEIDADTIRHLELVENARDSTRRYTLIEVLDKTLTPMGSRILKNWLLTPLKNPHQINKRLAMVELFYNDPSTLNTIRTQLKGMADIERITTRIALNRLIPRDLVQLRESLKKIKEVIETLQNLENTTIKDYLSNVPGDVWWVIDLLEKAITDDPPSNFEQGGIIKTGYNEELDELRKIKYEGEKWLSEFQERERQKTNIPSLKVGYNKVMGYYIEVTKPNLKLVPSYYIRKQTLVNAERFTTPELEGFESKMALADEKIVQLEQDLFNKIVEKVSEEVEKLQSLARFVGEIDVFCSLALVAQENNYTKPIVDDGEVIEIRDGRHPVVEKQLLEKKFEILEESEVYSSEFVPNDLLLDGKENRILIITGPNMAGKSTYLRQNALIIIMAQMGSFVPAKYAHIGTVDKIFTRIGASDYIAMGESTFLVEMKEVANILNNATERSFIVMDEVGRGTSTFDGLSIAWAVVEYMKNNPDRFKRVLFATHYHELTVLGEKGGGIKNYNVAVEEWKDKIVFLRKVIPGPADKSYGIHVAKLAGIPENVIKRASHILQLFEKRKEEKKTNTKEDLQLLLSLDILDIFQAQRHQEPTQPQTIPEEYIKVIEKLKSVDINAITPVQALNLLYELIKLVK